MLDVARAIREGKIRLARDEVVALTTTPGDPILRQNHLRARALISNFTASTGAVGYDKQTSTTRGCPLPANGGGVTVDFEEVGPAAFKEHFAVLGAAGNVHVLEWEAFE